MCEFCEKIRKVREERTLLSHPLKVETEDFPAREKLVLCEVNGNIRFYGFNKYNYEDDVIYRNVESVNFCPICGRKL